MSTFNFAPGKTFQLSEYRKRYMSDVPDEEVWRVMAHHITAGMVVPAGNFDEVPRFRLGPEFFRRKAVWN